MKKIRKTIVSPGVFHVKRPTGEDGVEAFSLDRLKKIADRANNMIKKGLKIPAPFAHYDKDGRAPRPVIMGNDGASLMDPITSKPIGWRSDLNAGFWSDFQADDQGLHAIVEVPDDIADKLGTTIQETSVYIEPTYKSGDGTEWNDDVLMHAALVTHGRETGQPNFELDNPAPMAMSFSMSDEVTENSEPVTQGNPASSANSMVEQAIESLRNLGLQLPEDTDESNIIERIILVANQKAADDAEADQDDLTTPPEGSQTRTPTIAMSDTNNNEPQVDKAAAILMSNFVNSKKQDLLNRIKKLVETGRINKDYADKELISSVNSFSMSLEDVTEDGSFGESRIEQRIRDLEASNPLTGPTLMSDSLPTGASIEDNPLPESDNIDLDEETMDKFADEVISMI